AHRSLRRRADAVRTLGRWRGGVLRRRSWGRWWEPVSEKRLRLSPVGQRETPTARTAVEARRGAAVSLPDLLLTERRARRCRLAPDEAQLLLVNFRGQFDLVPEGGHVWRVTPRAVAGVLRTARRRIVVRPRVPAANLPWLMGLREAMSPGTGALG